MTFVVIGDGRLRGQIEAAAAELPDHLRYLPPVPRDHYLTLAAACDIGLVVTIQHTDVPTFPSRTIDYLRVGLPIVAAVEKSTDFGSFITEAGLGAHVDAGDPGSLVAAALDLLSDEVRLEETRAACRIASREVFSARRAAHDMLAHATG